MELYLKPVAQGEFRAVNRGTERIVFAFVPFFAALHKLFQRSLQRSAFPNTPGTYYIYLRALIPSSTDDSVHVGLDDGLATGTGEGLTGFDNTGFTWQNHHDNTDTSADIPVPGRYTLYLWMREDSVYSQEYRVDYGQ